MITHFLTIRRYYEHLDIIEDREYSYDHTRCFIIEKKYYRNPFNFEIEITGKERLKDVDAYDFVINLAEMINNPGIIFEDLDFVQWYADSVYNETLRPIS